MRNLEYRIKKLEQTNRTNQDAIREIIDKSDLSILEKTGFLVDAGLLDAETIAKWIMEGSKNG